jgi:anaphase-promoting complex subunit 3
MMENMDIYGTCLWHLRKDVELSYLGRELEALDPKAPQTWCVIGNLYRQFFTFKSAKSYTQTDL